MERPSPCQGLVPDQAALAELTKTALFRHIIYDGITFSPDNVLLCQSARANTLAFSTDFTYLFSRPTPLQKWISIGRSTGVKPFLT